MQALVLLLVVVLGGVPGQRRQYLVLTGAGQAVYELGGGIPVAGSDTVLVDGRRLERGADYSIEDGGERLVLRFSPAGWSTILVSYHSAGGRVAAPGVRLAGDAEADDPVVDTATVAREAGDGEAAELEVSGSKSLGFSVGGLEGSDLNQATRLVVSGTVENVLVEAELSDQNSPIPAEGTTRQLDELDRIAISLRGADWSGQFGDVTLSMPQAALGRVERRAVGGVADARFGPVQARLGYARPRGISVRLAFRGQDGVQGPYVLSPDGRQVSVVPGTERVWLDGNPLVRGWDADYTIDYATGELRFTNRQVITRASRVEASCQFQRDAWVREDLAGGLALVPGGGELALDWFRESDDPNRSLGYDLDEDDLAYLASIGGDTARAWLEGGTPVQPGTGPYIYEPEGGYYRYVGEDSGDFRVAFSYVGDSLGDYVYDDTLLCHRHVGERQGDYVARVRVDLPERREWYHGRAEFGRGQLGAAIAGTWLRTARNLLAPGGAGAEDGAAEATLGWRSDRLAASYTGAWQTEGLEFSGTDSALGFPDRWGGLQPGDARLRNEVAIDARPADWFEARGEAGLVLTSDDGRVGRLASSLRAWFVHLAASRAGRQTRCLARLEPRAGIFHPRLEGRFEGTESARDRRLGIRLDAPFSEDLAVGVGTVYDIRSLDDSTGWTDERTGWLTSADLAWRSGERVNVRARAGRQDRMFPGRAADDWQRWLGDIAVVALPVAGTRFQIDFSQSNGTVQAKDEIFRYVGEGKGGFRRDSTSGRYYADPQGDYERTVVVRAERMAACERAANLGVDLSTWRPAGLSAALNYSATSTDSGVSAAAFFGTGRLVVRALEPWVEPQLGFDAGSSEDRTLEATGQASSRRRLFLEVAARHWSGLSLTARADRSFDRRYRGAMVDLDESGWGFGVEPIVGAVLRLELLLGYADNLITSPVSYPELGVFRLQTVESALARNFVIAGRSRVRAELGSVYRWSPVEELPFEVALTRPLGLTPHAAVTVTHVLSDILTASAGYRFADRPDRAAEHSLTGEMRAYF